MEYEEARLNRTSGLWATSLRIVLSILKGFAGFILLALLASTLPYSCSKIYDFPESRPFEGSTWFNPYSDIDSTSWIKANFHAHTRAYGGLTDGHNTSEKLFSHYRWLGYDVIGISNYQTINQEYKDSSIYIPCYEHGYSVWKRHHVMIGANEVSWYDFLFMQSIHHKQDMLEHLRGTADVVAIAHPMFRNSFEPGDFSKLVGYGAIEVLNHYRTSNHHWDSALSAGRPAWIVSDDDTHDVRKDGETGVMWTMIWSPERSRRSVTRALAKGQAYGVQGRHGRNQLSLVSCQVLNDSLTIRFSHVADSVEFIGQGGHSLGKAYHAKQVTYLFGDNDTYVRTMAWRDSTKIWLNPVFRTSDGRPPVLEARINWLWTIAYKAPFFLLYALLLWWLLTRVRRAKR